MQTTRPSFREIYMAFALKIAERSTCSRLKVGTVITSDDFRYVYGLGYNGGASGLPDNDCESLAAGECGHLHSEVNALFSCREPRSTPKIMFVTHLPCRMCAKSIINVGGFKTVYYMNTYRDESSLALFDMVSINCVAMRTE